MRLSILHRTTFRYAGTARDSFNELRLRPIDDENQTCLRFDLRISPAAEPGEYRDFHGNSVRYFDIAPPHATLVIESRSEVDTRADALRPAPETVPFEALSSDENHVMLCEFLSATKLVPLDAPEIRHEAEIAFAGTRLDVMAEIARIAGHIHRTFVYHPGVTGVRTTAAEAVALRRGVCQDYAHGMLGLCRIAGIPARYVSGYFFNDTRLDGEIEASHAWVEAHVPGHGWTAFDPTHNRPADERYVKIAVGRDYDDVRPVHGTYSGAPTGSLEVEVAVLRLDEDRTAEPPDLRYRA